MRFAPVKKRKKERNRETPFKVVSEHSSEGCVAGAGTVY